VTVYGLLQPLTGRGGVRCLSCRRGLPTSKLWRGCGLVFRGWWPRSMRLTMFAFVMKSPVSVRKNGTCCLFASSALKIFVIQSTCWRRPQRGHMSCVTMAGAAGTVPQEHLWEREAPRAAWSVLDEGSSQDTSPLGRAVTSVTTALASSMLLHAHHDPARSALRRQQGPP
jgi:hypothetical protein